MKEKLEAAMLELKKGDSDALATIYDLTYKGVFTFVLPIVKNYQVAEDIMHDTFIAVYEKCDSYVEGTNVRNWILTIAKNLAFNEFNKQKRVQSFDYDQDQVTPEGLYALDSSLDTPIIKLANEILDEDEFKIVIMYAVGDYKHREIADMLGIPLGTVTWKYKNALEKLRNELEKQEKDAEERLRARA